MKPLNYKEIGHDMLAMVERAINIIRQENKTITVTEKTRLDGKEDFYTNGDRAAQDMYLERIAQTYPHFGIIAEEDNLRKPSAVLGHNIYFTIDPLDGTKAYKRQQAYGVGTMIALVCDGKIVAVTIGDVNSGEIFHYAGDEVEGNVTFRKFDHFTNLTPDTDRPLRAQYVQLREMPQRQPAIVNDMILHPEEGGLFKDGDVGGGSIGLVFGRLWKGEVGAIVTPPGRKTPWDVTPIYGINRRLGFKFFKIDHKTKAVEEIDPKAEEQIVPEDFSLLAIHKAHEGELKQWLANN